MENVERKDLTLWERLRNLEKIVGAFAASHGLDGRAVSATDLSRLLGCSLPHAMNYMATLNADQTVKDLVRSNKIKNLEKAALIANIRSASIKQEAIDACLAGATFKKLKSLSTQDRAKKTSTAPTPALATRGRQAQAVNLGTTKKVTVARLIIDSVLEHEKVNHLKGHFSDLNWSDFKSINHAFKQLLKTLEQIEA
jgi:hypothetical protein